MRDFLAAKGWTLRGPIAEDGASRRYYRADKNGRSAVLMESYGDTPGHRIADFIRLGAWINAVGLKAPEVYEAEEARGLLLIEDFGDTSFAAALDNGRDPEEVYALGHDVLRHLAAQKNLPDLPDYYGSHVHRAHRRVVDWYVPVLKKQKNPQSLAEDYLDVWRRIESGLPPCPQGFVHADFHAENLMWLDEKTGLRRCGILDFQGAMRGPLPYDLGNLLEDIRRDVPEDLRSRILSGYDENFRAHYRVLTTQFHCRLIGQCIRWALLENKPRYLRFIPRISVYLREALEEPVLAPLKTFFFNLDVDFTREIDMNNARAHIGAEAF